MDSFKTILISLSASVALHGAIGVSLGDSFSNLNTKPSEPIQIDYLRHEIKSQPEFQKEAVAKQPVLIAKKNRGIPVPKMTTKAEPQEKPAPSDFQKFITQKLKKQELDLARLTAEHSQPEIERPKTSAEVMADPVKGKIFISYFGEVKKKIQRTLIERYSHRYLGEGSVTLAFVLNPNGRIESVIVASKDEQADEFLQELAVRCLKDSAPFGNFPASLGSQKIAFNVTIFFDGR